MVMRIYLGRYTGTELTGALKEDPIKNPDKAMQGHKKASKTI